MHRHPIECLLRSFFAFNISASRDGKQQQLDVEAARMKSRYAASIAEVEQRSASWSASSSRMRVEADMHAGISGTRTESWILRDAGCHSSIHPPAN